MTGKLLGTVGGSLTILVVYLVGGYVLASSVAGRTGYRWTWFPGSSYFRCRACCSLPPFSWRWGLPFRN